MGVRLDPDEQRELLTGSHTGVPTTLRADGHPVAPVWFVLLDDAISAQAGPAAARCAYADVTILRLTPVGRPPSWANAGIRPA